jgi:peptidoglycan/xylan/chitin deacetylase (PgdA/CDA1 family)
MMRSKATVPVLMYHSIAANTLPSFAKLTVSPTLFEEHLAALREQHIEVIPFHQVPMALTEGRRAVAITIDDGLADAADGAVPALIGHGLAATLFVPTAFVGTSASWLHGDDGRRPMLSWSTIVELARSGFEIGSHGKFHLAADINARKLVRDDAAASKSELEQRVGRPVRSFAYPFGYYSRRARQTVRDVGYAQACAVSDLPAQPGDDRWSLPRLQVDNGTSPEHLLEMINWQPATLTRRWAHLKQGAWRAGRRLGTGWGPAEANRIVELPK